MKNIVKSLVLAAVVAPIFAVVNAVYQVHFFTAVNDVQNPADCLIVLGARSLPGGRPGLMMRERLETAEPLASQKYETVIVTGGTLDEEKAEAVVMKEYLENEGVDAQKILVEDKSTSTQENLTFSLPLIEQASCESVDILSHDFHLARVRLVADQLEIPLRNLIAAQQNRPDSSSRLSREYLAYAWYWLEGFLNN